MFYEFSGVAETNRPDVNANDVQALIVQGFKDDKTVTLSCVSVSETEYQPPRFTYTALDRQVLVVAVPGEVGDWAAYIGAVPGKRHEDEVDAVAHAGTKLSLSMAKLLFPQFDPEQYRL